VSIELYAPNRILQTFFFSHHKIFLQGVVEIFSINFDDIIVPERNWSEVVPRNLYNKKPEALRMADAGSSSGSSSPPCSSGTPCTGAESTRKRTISEELEWAKVMKRRRPSISSPPVPDENQAKLLAAKLQLTLATQANLDLKQKREQELFEIEKRRKESEAELVQLQVLKMKKELGLLE
jgi:hypothetical protein